MSLRWGLIEEMVNHSFFLAKTQIRRKRRQLRLRSCPGRLEECTSQMRSLGRRRRLPCPSKPGEYARLWKVFKLVVAHQKYRGGTKILPLRCGRHSGLLCLPSGPGGDDPLWDVSGFPPTPRGSGNGGSLLMRGPIRLERRVRRRFAAVASAQGIEFDRGPHQGCGSPHGALASPFLFT